MQTAIKTELTLTDIDKMFDAVEIIETDDCVCVGHSSEEFKIEASWNKMSDETHCEIWTKDNDNNYYDINDEIYSYIINKLVYFHNNNTDQGFTYEDKKHAVSLIYK